MNYCKFYFVLLFIFISACIKRNEQPAHVSTEPKVAEAKGYVVPADSISEPRVVPAGKPKLVKLDVSPPIPINTNIHLVGRPKVIKTGKPKICVSGQGGFTLPKTVPAISKPYLAGIPDIILAKDPVERDKNSQNFTSFNIQQGLLSMSVSNMLQDRNGNIWIATIGGVSKFDGKNFTNYTRKEGLHANIVRSLIQDHNGNFWFGTQEDGVTKYDGKYFTQFTVKEGLLSDRIWSIYEDRNGNIWFGTMECGVSRLNSDGKTFTHFTEKEGLSNNFVYTISGDNEGNLWFGTLGGGACRLGKDGRTFTHFTEKEGIGNNFVTSVLEDKNGSLWIGSYDGGGVSKLSRDGRFITRYSCKEGMSSDFIECICEDKYGNLWFGTGGGGVSRLDRDGHNFTHFSGSEGLGDTFVSRILEDRTGNIWIGTYTQGVFKFSGNIFTHYTEDEGLGSNTVNNILSDKSGNLWIGTRLGISRLNRDGKSLTNFSKKASVSENVVSGLLEDKLGNIWFGSNAGFGVMKYDGKNFYQYTVQEGLVDNSVWDITEDKSGNIWFGTAGGGVCRLNPDGTSFTHFTEKEGMSNNYVVRITEDYSGNMWFATRGGVTKYDGNRFTHFTEKEGLGNNSVLSVQQDITGDLWFATFGGGVTRLSRDGSKLTHYTDREGLGGNDVTNVFPDKSGNLWFTSYGLSRLSLSALTGKSPVIFKNYAVEDGFLGVAVGPGAIHEDPRGTIWFGTTDRLTAYHPAGDLTDTIPPCIQLMSIELYNESIPWAIFEQNQDTVMVLGNGVHVQGISFDSLSKWYFLPEDLSLAFNNNFLTFNYIGITQKGPKKVKYQYKLDGFDENWSAITSRTEAPYGNLPQGTYTFKVKAVNGDGYWSNEFSYPFTIRPPWFKTIWFQALSVLVIFILLYALHIWRTASLRRRQKKLEKIVERRTAEVVRQKEEIECQKEEVECQKEELEITLDKLRQTQAQLIQSEKMASLGMLTAGIAHEINNPVNFINSGAISLQKDYEELQDILQTMEQFSPETQKIAEEMGMEELMKIIPQTIEDIKTGVQRTSEIVKGLRNFTRIDSSEMKEADLHEGIDSTLLLLSNKIKNRIRIFKSYDDRVRFIRCYPGPLNQVFMNLLNNAIDAIDQKIRNGSQGEIESRVTPPDDQYQIGIITKLSAEGLKKQVQITVTDNGSGIPEEIRDKLFDPFFTTKEIGKGTGLGLSICHGIIEKHGGRITFESRINEGSSFTVVIPLT